MTAILSFIVATCIVLGGGLIIAACIVVGVAWCVFMVTDHIQDGPRVQLLERWLSHAFLAGSILSSVAAVGVLILAGVA